MAFDIGQSVGDYRIINIIGRGGMGTVYKVQHQISDRIEAMKVILPELIDSSELADRFIREIKVQARLSHPNITSLHNALRFGNELLMVMEFVEGTTLYERLRKAGMDPGSSVHVISQVLDALSYAHAHGVVHRDIKPANIMLTANGSVKLMDFGIARSLTDHKELTRTGAAIGSLHYMSPEQVQGAAVDHRSDIYSVGIVLYEMVTGTKPIQGDSSWAIMNAHLNQIPRSPAAINRAIPISLSLAILKAIEKDPADRYQNAAEFLETLGVARNRHLRDAGAAAIPDVTAQAVPQVRVTPAAAATPLPITPTGTPARNTQLFETRELDRVKQDLAAYVGPMARIIVDRAAKKATNWDQFYDIISKEVPEGSERKRFLAGRLH